MNEDNEIWVNGNTNFGDVTAAILRDGEALLRRRMWTPQFYLIV
jgi:hypothetical protein